MAKILKKLVIKNIVGEKLRDIAAGLAEGETKPLAQVYGRASAVKVGSTNYGDWAGLVGNFEAVNLATGETFVSPICILPEPANSMTVAAVTGGKPLPEGDAKQAVQVAGAQSVDFAFGIGIKRNDKVAIGYEFTAEPLIKTTGADALAGLRQQIAGALPAPPAAEPVTEPAAEPVTEPAPAQAPEAEPAKAATKRK